MVCTDLRVVSSVFVTLFETPQKYYKMTVAVGTDCSFSVVVKYKR